VSDPLPLVSHVPVSNVNRPDRWLGSAALLDLEDPKLRLRAHALTQLCKGEREKALAVHHFVKCLPFSKRFKLRPRTARQVLDAGRGDAPEKGALLVALLRCVGIPARLLYVELRGDILRGLTSSVATAGRPVAEIWLDGRWVRSDTYIFDTPYMVAARQRLKDMDWEWGYGIHRNGQSIWNGADDAFLGGVATERDPMVLASLGVYHDPLDFMSSQVYRGKYRPLARALQWNLLAPAMDKVARDLREEGSAGSAGRRRKPS
jgi:hypothetical protein